MTYQVLARKWRPQTFEEIVGQTTVTRTLQSAILNKRIAHAYLFAGPRGVGKTTTARILAKALNCKDGPTPHPCCGCPSCLEIAKGNSIDVLEIDAASNRGINEIRELREIARYNPARDRYKIFIIDEVHMLTAEAFNALLKTLEEPPSYVAFILATTEAHKIPQTILSRCQQFDFKNISYRLISDRLKFIAAQENISVSDYALQQMAIASQGSMRDAQSTFDQLIAFGGKEIKDQDVASFLGLVDQALLDRFTYAVLNKEGENLLVMIDRLVDTGLDLQNFCRKLIAHFRNLLIIKVAGADESLLAVPKSEHDSLIGQAQNFSEEDLLRFYDLLSKTESELKWSTQPRFHLEVGLLKLVQLRKLPSLEDLIKKFNSVLKNPKEPESPRVANDALTAPAKPAQTEPDKVAIKASVPEKKVEKLLDAIQKEKEFLYNFVAHADSIKWNNNLLEISVPPGHFDYVSRKENVALIKTMADQMAEGPVVVKILVASEARTIQSAQSSAVPQPVTEPQPIVTRKQEKAETLQQPKDPFESAMGPSSTRLFLETFSGKINLERL